MALSRTAGPLLMMVALPPFTYYLYICLADFGGALVVPASVEEARRLLARIPPPTPAAVALYGGWLLLQAALQQWAPGRLAPGLPLEDGSRLTYRLNGWLTFWITLALAVGAAAAGLVPPAVAYDHFGTLLTTANIVAFAGSLFLYFQGQGAGATTGNPVRDYFMGPLLNPRLADFDLKYFCESRPGLILWVLFDLSFAAAQYQRHGTLATPILLVTAFQLLYVADYFLHEEAILSTWDIRRERFGWMLCWGDLVWVPFTYTLQAYYLVDHPHELPWVATVAIVALNLAGYTIFRGTNIQKHRFRLDPAAPVWGRKPEYIRTAQGGLLLTSGWWGLARHFNYLGDLLMALAWCLPAGFAHPVPWFYFAFMIALLVHRERRDNAACLEKYGADWDAYCRKVRWRILPGVY
jgi:delta14-sterol reductase/lamin-B receptor